jgi:epsilon-lactone hydrolase
MANSTKLGPVEQANQRWRDLLPPGAEPTLELYREGTTRMFAEFVVPDDAGIDELSAGGVPVLSVRAPEAGDEFSVIHLHSGGCVMGSAADYREFAYRLSSALGARVLVVDYRLAPENPFPAQLEDSLAVYRWLNQTVDASRIVLTGDSAGGGLVLATMMALRDYGEKQPAAAALISPVTDQAGEGASLLKFLGTDPVITEAVMTTCSARYAEGIDPKVTPLMSPLYGDASGLAPVHFEVGEAECLLDDSRRMHANIRSAGGTSEIEIIPEVPHIWTVFPYLRESAEALYRISTFVSRYVAH